MPDPSSVEQQIFLLFIGMLVLIGVSRFIASKAIKEADRAMDPRCPPHKWTYDTANKMVCETCKRPPGEDQGAGW